MRRDGLTLDDLNVKNKNIQRALRRNLRVFLSKRPRRRVARVGEQLFFQKLLPLAQPQKAFVRHIYLAAHLQKRQRLFERLRYGFDRTDIQRHVFARNAVAARRAARVYAVHVFQRHGKAVEFRLYHIHRVVHNGAHAAVKVAQLVFGKRVVQTLHRHGVRHFRQCVVPRCAHAVRRRVLCFQLRERRFQIFQAAVQHVVRIVADLRRVLGIVFFIVILDLFPQRLNLLPGLFVRHKLKLRVISRYFDTC